MTVQAWSRIETVKNEQVPVANQDAKPVSLSARSSGAEVFLNHRYSRTTCSDIHDVVLEFRRAHNRHRGEYACADAPTLQCYPLERAPDEEYKAILKLSSLEVYADIRHGGGLRPRYPAIRETIGRIVCEELRAAFVWKACFVRGLMS